MDFLHVVLPDCGGDTEDDFGFSLRQKYVFLFSLYLGLFFFNFHLLCLLSLFHLLILLLLCLDQNLILLHPRVHPFISSLDLGEALPELILGPLELLTNSTLQTNKMDHIHGLRFGGPLPAAISSRPCSQSAPRAHGSQSVNRGSPCFYPTRFGLLFCLCW